VPVGGRPLFEWARSGKIFEIAIPRRDMNFKKIRISEISSLSSEDILNHIRRSVFKVRGDFRQEQTLSEWERVLKNGNASYPLSKISVECSAGSYVRSLAYESGRNSESCAVLFSLKRTRVGNFTIADSIRPESN
jgi:tRNA U55 pseudouridine synthase TruB